MSELLQSLWQSNIELSLLLVAVMLARLVIHKTTKVYNSYLLWLSIPIGLLLARLISSVEFSEPPVAAVSDVVQNYIVQPSNVIQGWTVLGFFWGLVVALLLLRLARQHFELRRELSDITVAIDIGCESSYPIVGIDKDEFSPAVYGFLKPRIYFPTALQTTLSDKQIELIIRHEEHHITQQHLWLNLLWDVLVCVFWFNPLIYLSRQGFRHDQELFCDYLVLNKSSNPSDHQSYGHALLSTVTATHSVSLLCSWKNFNQLEERIMNIKKSTSLAAKIAITSLAAIIVASTSLYAVSAEQYKDDAYLSSSIEDNGDSEYIWRDGDKRYIEKNGRRFTMQDDTKRPMTDAESIEFTGLLEKSKSNKKDSLRHSIDDNGEQIEWKTGEISYIKDNGEYLVKQYDIARPMTSSEKQTFEEKVKSAQLENKQYRKALKKAKVKSKPQKITLGAFKHKEKKSLREKSDSTQINWNKDGKTIIVANDKHYLIDENGKREMTSNERKALDKNVASAQQEWGGGRALTQSEERRHAKELRQHEQSEREHERAMREEERKLQRAESEAHRQQQKEHAMHSEMEKEQHALELAYEIEKQQREREHQVFETEQKRLEFEAQWEQFAVQQEEFETQMQEFEMQMHEYEIAPEVFQEQLQEFSLAEKDYQELYQDAGISDDTMRQIERSLAIAEKQFKTDRVDLKKKLKHARAEVNRARVQLHKQRAGLHTPKARFAPRAPVLPISPTAPDTPVAPSEPIAPEVPLAVNDYKGVIQIPGERSESVRVQQSDVKRSDAGMVDFDSFNSAEPH